MRRHAAPQLRQCRPPVHARAGSRCASPPPEPSRATGSGARRATPPQCPRWQVNRIPPPRQRDPRRTRRVRSRRIAGAREIAVAGECPQREVLGVAVILEEEDAREPGRVEPRIAPYAVGLLPPQQVLDTTPHRRRVDLAAVHETEECPRRLARAAVTRARDWTRIPVALAAL